MSILTVSFLWLPAAPERQLRKLPSLFRPSWTDVTLLGQREALLIETTVGALLWSFCRSSWSLSRCEFPTFVFKLSLQSLPFLPIFSLPNYFLRNREFCQRAFCPRKSNSFGFCPGFCGQPFNLGTLILEWILGETNPLAGTPLRLVVKVISRTQMIS